MQWKWVLFTAWSLSSKSALATGPQHCWTVTSMSPAACVLGPALHTACFDHISVLYWSSWYPYWTLHILTTSLSCTSCHGTHTEHCTFWLHHCLVLVILVPVLNTVHFDHISVFYWLSWYPYWTLYILITPVSCTGFLGTHSEHCTFWSHQCLVLVVLVPMLNTARFDEIKTKSDVILKIMTFAFCCAEQLMAIKESYDLSYSDLWFCLTLDTVTCVLFDLRHCDLYPVWP